MNGDTNPADARIRSFNESSVADQRTSPAYDEQAGWSDEALMTAVLAQDEIAFVALYDRYADLVYSTSLRVLSDRHLAEDATQDVFVRIWQRPESFVAARGRFVSWLMSVTRNRAVDELRSRGRRHRREAPGIDSVDDPPGLPVDHYHNEPLHAAQLHEEQVSVRGALTSLPAEQRVALELAYFGGLTQQEIALKLHEPLGTVKTRIRLGMQKLRAALSDMRS